MKRTRQDFLPYVRHLADSMRLRDWDFCIADELAAVGAMASILCVSGRKLGTIRFNEAFLAEDESEQRYIVVHELTHCHCALADAIAESEIDEDHVDAYQLASEHAVDGVAMALAQFMPLPTAILDQKS